MRISSTKPRAREIQTRRRVVFFLGVASLVASGASATLFASGCIFDEGGYDGGGRRTGAPLETETAEPPAVPTGTATSTSTPRDSGDNGSGGGDAGADI